MQTPKYWYQN